MIKIFFGDDSRLEKLKEDIVEPAIYFHEDTVDNFMKESVSVNIFGANPTLVLKGAEKIKDLSFLSKIPKSRNILIEAYDEKGEFIKRVSKIELTKIECRRRDIDRVKDLMERLDIDRKDAIQLSRLLKNNYKSELIKLESYFLNSDFNMEDAEKLIVGEEEIAIFQSIEDLFKGKIESTIKYAKSNPPALPFIYAVNATLKVILKIKLLNLSPESYSKFTKDTYPKFKNILPHPYFVFKNLRLANTISDTKLSHLILECLEAEKKVRKTFPNEAIILSIASTFKELI